MAVIRFEIIRAVTFAQGTLRFLEFFPHLHTTLLQYTFHTSSFNNIHVAADVNWFPSIELKATFEVNVIWLLPQVLSLIA